MVYQQCLEVCLSPLRKPCCVSSGGAGAYLQSEDSPFAASSCPLLSSEIFSFLVMSDHWPGMAEVFTPL
jgi:hypothetical protein